MKKSLSVKSALIIAFISMFGAAILLGYNFTRSYQQTIYGLNANQFQTTALSIRHYLGAYYDSRSFKTKVAHLDNIVAVNDMISDMHILNDSNQSLYDADRNGLPYHPESTCHDISRIDSLDVQNLECLDIPIFSGSGNFKLLIYLDKTFLYEKLEKPRQTYLMEFMLLVAFFLFLSIILLYKLLVRPMEQLRHYAYYGQNPPHPFFIGELEGIRYSLKTTLDRLQNEQDKLYDLSINDPLTGLNNRNALTDKLDWLIFQSRRNHEKFALLFLDLDNFKYVNDIYGHNVGDQLLKTVALRISATIRKNDFASRFGGDEFVIILPSIQTESSILDTLNRIMNAVAAPIQIDNISINISCSIGIALFPEDGDEGTALIQHADMAMYSAKDRGKNSYAFFEKHLNLQLKEELKIKKLIEEALENDYFTLLYQPQVDIASGQIIGCEALIRIYHPIEGAIAPNSFIPVAERHGLINAIGQWVVQSAARQLKVWQSQELDSIKIAINISANEFMQKEFLDNILNATEGIQREQLCIELTESVLMNRLDENIKIIEKLKVNGFAISLDDFGTGYSSLAYLKRLPIDILKIDKSFVDDILTDPNDKLFIEMIINIAHTLKLTVIAEGVESDAQLQALTTLDCDIYQGYYCSKPVDAQAFEKLFNSSRCDELKE